MTLSTSVDISYDEAQALYTTVRYGRYYVQENPQSDADIQLSLKAQGLVADRLASRVLSSLCDEFLEDREAHEGEVDAAYLSDARVPDCMNLVHTLLSQEVVEPERGKKRHLRGHFTGGEKDIYEFYAVLKEAAATRGFEATFFEEKPFGDVGPLHKLTFGFTMQ
jgi:hypothetical protein